MSIDVQLVPGYNSTVLPGNKHTYDGRRIVGADMFRVDMTLIIPATPDESRTDFEEHLLPEHVTPGEPYGLILMSSQLFDCMYLTTPALVEAYREKRFELPRGIVYGGWPGNNGGGQWRDLLPQTTWYPKGVGILDEIEGVAGAKVTIYEYTVDKAQAYNHHAEPVGELVNMVTYHCDRCHTPAPFDLGEKFENLGPSSRYFAFLKARTHARGADGHCSVPDGEMERVVSQVVSDMRGRQIELPGPASACAAEKGCSQVRRARAATILLTAA